jgi:alkylation response protein AidB-like acyl-CoA dehydrogenase
VEEVLDRVGKLAPFIRQSAAEAERLARLPQPLVRALLQHGLFRLWIPKQCAGFELDLSDALEVFEAVARIDGSAGWAVMIGASGGLFASHVDAATATSVFARPEAVLASAVLPEGRATPVAGGYRVTGCWHGATGALYATTFLANCILMDGGAAVFGSDGRPLTRTVLLDSSQVCIVPVWDAAGLCGTGSDDFDVREALVPEQRTFSLTNTTSHESGPLYRLPLGAVNELAITAVALGIAQHALDEFVGLTRRKKIAGQETSLADDSGIQARHARAQYGQARATCGLIKAGVDALARRMWRDALTARTPSQSESGEVTASCALSVTKLRDMLGELLALAGVGVLQSDTELARAWRDLQALPGNAVIAPRNFTSSGATHLAASAAPTR